MKEKLVRYLPYLLLTACVLLFLTLVLVNINLPVWFDEGYSAYLVKGNFSEIWGLTAVDVHPPFYYYLLKVWSFLFGASLVSLRMMSVFFGMASIVLLFFLVKHWFGKKAAVMAALAMSISPFLIRYGMEMRMYMVILVIVLSATLVLTLAVERKQKKYWVMYTILVALGMYTHYFTALVWLTQLLYLQFVLKKPVYKAPIIFAYLGAVLLYLPWIPSLLSQMKSISGGFWIPPVTAETPVNFLINIFFFKSAGELAGWSVVLALVFAVVYFVVVRKGYKVLAKTEKKHYLGLLLLFLLPPIALIIVSLVYKPMFVDRYLVPSSIIAWVILGLGLILWPRKKTVEKCVLAVSSLVVVIATVFGITNVLNRAPDSHVAEIITKVHGVTGNEPILADDIWVFLGAAIYTSDAMPVYGTLETTFTNGWGSEEPMKYYESHLARKDSQVYATLEDFLNENHRFWYITEQAEKLPAENLKVIDEVKTEHHYAYKVEIQD